MEYWISLVLDAFFLRPHAACLVCVNLSMTDGYGEFEMRLLRYLSNWPLDAIDLPLHPTFCAPFSFSLLLIRALLNRSMICIPTNELARPSMSCTKKYMHATNASRKRTD